ncbi:MAG: hypothetical protein CL521_01090 [Actinobacteria bacterium]|nr:hypothetical protein [Actinomycetota bacterium]
MSHPYPPIRDLLSQGDTVLICVHQFPDLDAIGSALACYWTFSQLGVTARIWVPDQDGVVFDFLPGASELSYSCPDGVFDSIWILDCSSLSRLPAEQKVARLVEEGLPLVNVDHHVDNQGFGSVNVLRPVSSVGELLSAWFLQEGLEINSKAAQCLYTAINFDTGRFSYSNVTQQTHAIVAELLNVGVDVAAITQAMYERFSLQDFEVMKMALDKVTVHPGSLFAYTIMPKKLPPHQVKVIDLIRQLDQVVVFVVFQELSANKVKVSMRSKSIFDVQQFAAKFGGGGHVRAAGVVLTGESDQVIPSFLAQLASDMSGER